MRRRFQALQEEERGDDVSQPTAREIVLQERVDELEAANAALLQQV